MNKNCHSCGNCISNDEEFLICLLTNKLVNFDHYCTKWIIDEEFEEILR